MKKFSVILNTFALTMFLTVGICHADCGCGGNFVKCDCGSGK